MDQTEIAMNAESSLAGAILVDERCMSRIPTSLRDTDFLSESCRTVFRAAKTLHQMGQRVDPVTVLHWSQAHRCALTPQTLAELMEVTPTCENAGEYARIVHESALRRAFQQMAAQASGDSSTPLEQLIAGTMEQMGNLSTHVSGGRWVSGDSVAYEPPRWLIEPYIPRGKGTLIQADPGTGKTALVCALAAAVTTGRSALGLRVETPGNVLMLSTEDDLGVLRGRIEACGGDMKRVFFMQNAAGMTLNSPEILEQVKKTGARLLVFDPFQAFLGPKVDLFRANETRPILAKLFEMCSQQDCACVIIAHLGKSTLGKSAVNQSLGSVDIPGAMRSILHIARNPNQEGELIAVHIKSSNAAAGKSIAYSIGKGGGVVFHGFSDLKLEDLNGTRKQIPFEEEPMAEVLAKLTEEKSEGFFSYEELRSFSVKVLGFAPFTTTRELLRRLENPEFLQKLRQEEGLMLTPRVRSGQKRGIRLEHCRHPEGTQMTVSSVSAVSSLFSVQGK